MKIVHTADWHIGKIVNERSMIEDQAHILQQWLEKTKTINPDIVLVAGDLYDRSLPGREAIKLANHILTTMINELDCPVCIISGNHDSGEYIAYANQLLQNQRLYMVGLPTEKVVKVAVNDADIYMLPFADYATLRRSLDNEDIHSISEATNQQIAQIKTDWDPERINILMFHGYVTSADLEAAGSDLQVSDSERPISIGTAEYVPVEVFKDFDYVALGHLHAAQSVGVDRVRYSGSPLKYSKSEVHHQKQFLEIDLYKQDIEITKHYLEPLHDMRTVKGRFEDLMQTASTDYVFIELTNKTVIHEGMNRLRKNYPHAMSLIYINLEGQNLNTKHNNLAGKDKMTNQELFAGFFEALRGEEMTAQQVKIVETVFEVVKEDS